MQQNESNVEAENNSSEPSEATSPSNQNEPSKSTVLKVGLALIAVVSILLIYNFNASTSYQDMADDVRENMFASPDVEGLLLTYRENKSLIELTVNVKGVSGELAAYQAEALAFVCQSSLLSHKLSGDTRVELQLTASLRKQDKYLIIPISAQNCLGIEAS